MGSIRVKGFRLTHLTSKTKGRLASSLAEGRWILGGGGVRPLPPLDPPLIVVVIVVY